MMPPTPGAGGGLGWSVSCGLVRETWPGFKDGGVWGPQGEGSTGLQVED